MHTKKILNNLLLKWHMLLGMIMEAYTDGENHVAGMCHSLCVKSKL